MSNTNKGYKKVSKKEMRKLFITEATHIRHLKKSHPDWFKKSKKKWTKEQLAHADGHEEGYLLAKKLAEK